MPVASIPPSSPAAGPGALVIGCLVLVLSLSGCGREPQAVSETLAEAADDSPLEHALKHRDPNYVCPMHPQIVRDAPATCPICGMDLVEKALEEGDADARPAVTLSAAVVQNMGVRTAKVERGTLWKYIRTQGTVEHDVDRILQIHPRAEGWIETLYVRTEGERVERKDDLADYVSPSVLWAQAEYLGELERDELASFDVPAAAPEPGSQRLTRARQLLRYLNVPEMYMMGIEDSYRPREILPIKAPQGGIVTRILAREGMYVTPADPLFTIVDLSEVWVMVDVFEHQIAWVRPGLSAEVSTPAYPGRTWQAKVDFVYPEVHPKARTLRARIEVRNPEELLLPNMFVQVAIYGGPKREVLTVPREALIVTGERTTVITAQGEGRFEPVDVTTGMWRGDAVEILAGLEEGDEVVVSGQFLIDSESNMQASLRRMMAN